MSDAKNESQTKNVKIENEEGTMEVKAAEAKKAAETEQLAKDKEAAEAKKTAETEQLAKDKEAAEAKKTAETEQLSKDKDKHKTVYSRELLCELIKHAKLNSLYRLLNDNNQILSHTEKKNSTTYCIRLSDDKKTVVYVEKQFTGSSYIYSVKT